MMQKREGLSIMGHKHYLSDTAMNSSTFKKIEGLVGTMSFGDLLLVGKLDRSNQKNMRRHS